MSPTTFRRRMDESPEVLAAYEKGRAAAIAMVAGKLFRKAVEGDTTAAIFFLKTQGGWKDTARVEVEARGGVLRVPMSMTSEEWEKAARDQQNRLSALMARHRGVLPPAATTTCRSPLLSPAGRPPRGRAPK
jgi:hypothetical protein